MPLAKNEKRPAYWRGPWIAEYYTTVGHKQLPDQRWGERIMRWRRYNRPHHHIHNTEKYEMGYLAGLLKAANDNFPGFTLRMRNTETGEIIMADIL
jgi:hypothetical protein